MAFDSLNGSVWAVAQGSGSSGSPEEAVFNWASGGSLVGTYPLDVSNPALDGGDNTPVVVDESGDAWVGIEKSVVEITSQGNMSVVPLPSVALVSASSSVMQPPASPLPPASYQNVDSLAVTASGQIAIGRVFSSQMQLMSTSNNAFTTVSLPSGAEFNGSGMNLVQNGNGPVVALLSEGSAGEASFALESGGGWERVLSGCTTWGVIATAASLVTFGPNCVSANAWADLNVASTAEPSPSVGSIPGSIGIAPGSADLAFTDATGLDITDVGGDTSTQLSLGTATLGPSSGGLFAGPEASPVDGASTTAPAGPVPVTVQMMVPDDNGGLYFVSNDGTQTIGEANPAS